MISPRSIVSSTFILLLTATLVFAQKSPRSRRGNQELAGTFHGTLKQLNGKEIVIQTSDDQTVVIGRSRKTKFMRDNKQIKAADVPIESTVSIDAFEDIDLKPTALTVTVETLSKPLVRQ